MLGPSFPLKRQEKGLHKEFRGGWVLGAPKVFMLNLFACLFLLVHLTSLMRRPHSTYQKVVQGKCPLHVLDFNGVVCSNTLFSNTSALTNSLLFRANSTRKGSRTPRLVEHFFRNGQSTVGGPKWTKMDLFKPKWTKMDHFGPFWSPEC